MLFGGEREEGGESLETMMMYYYIPVIFIGLSSLSGISDGFV